MFTVQDCFVIDALLNMICYLFEQDLNVREEPGGRGRQEAVTPAVAPVNIPSLTVYDYGHKSRVDPTQPPSSKVISHPNGSYINRIATGAAASGRSRGSWSGRQRPLCKYFIK